MAVEVDGCRVVSTVVDHAIDDHNVAANVAVTSIGATVVLSMVCGDVVGFVLVLLWLMLMMLTCVVGGDGVDVSCGGD